MAKSPLTSGQHAFRGLIGAARADITPPMGIYARNWGASTHDVAEGVHQPLTATALCIRSCEAGPPVYLLSLDLGWWRTAEDEWRFRSGLLSTLHVDVSRLLVCFSHTHSGPSICLDDRDRPGGNLIPAYLRRLQDTAAAVCQEAANAAKPACLEWERGACSLARDRDLREPGGQRFVCGYNPLSAAEQEMWVGRVASDGGLHTATIIHYACHPTTLGWSNRLISPDWVGAMRQLVEERTGRAPCLFLQGASGELAPRTQYSADTLDAGRNGEVAGFAALSALRQMLPPGTGLAFSEVVESGAPLAVWRQVEQGGEDALAAAMSEARIPLRARMEPLTPVRGAADRASEERALRRTRIAAALGQGHEASIPIWGVRLGPAIVVAQPNEAYAWLQQHLRNRFPDRPVLAVNVTNGPYCGYLPPAAAYGSDRYQVWQTPFDRGSLEAVGDAAVDLCRQLFGSTA